MTSCWREEPDERTKVFIQDNEDDDDNQKSETLTKVNREKFPGTESKSDSGSQTATIPGQLRAKDDKSPGSGERGGIPPGIHWEIESEAILVPPVAGKPWQKSNAQPPFTHFFSRSDGA
ncbi:uncharacterized [Tachysurus ichikawai]